MDIYNKVADELAGVATEAAQRAVSRGNVRLSMINAMAMKLHDSGIFRDGVPYANIIATVDSIFDEAAAFARKTMMQTKGLNANTLTADVITFDEALGISLAERSADNVISMMREKQNSRRIEHEASSTMVAPVVTADILHQIEKREQANKALSHYPASKKKGR